MWLGHSGCLLASELASSLRSLMLSVGLLSVGSRSLPLLKMRHRSKGWSLSGYGASIHSGTAVMARVVGASSIHGVVTTGAGEAPVPCL
jgi:hypothetical protein